MTSLSTLLSSLQKSSTKSSGWGTGGASGWGGSSSTWGGKSSSYVKIPKFGKIGKTSESQTVANKIMSGSKAKASHSNESVLGSILGGAADVTGNLVKDVVSTAENVPTGLYKIATTNPKDTLHAIGQDYKTRYGKLFGGDFGGFLHQVEQHPLSYGLDVATIATGGAGALAKAGVLSKELTQTGLSASRAATAVGDSAKVGINLSRNPATNLLQRGIYGGMKRLPENIPVVGENAAAKRAIATQYKNDISGLDPAGKTAVRKAYQGQYSDAADSALTKYNQHVKPGGFLGKSTQVWKDLVLAGRPAFQVNNFVGNQIMFHLRNGLASKSLQMASKGELSGTFDKFFGGSSHTFGGTEAGEGTSLYRRAVNKSYNVQGKHETLLRKAAMREAAMSIPDIKTAVRQGTGQGMSEAEALDAALSQELKGPKGHMYQQEISRSINDTMGDYSNYSAAEQRLKKVVPFYGWNRHSSRFLAATARDDPHVILALNQISKQGESFHDSQGFAGTPDFMKGYLKVGGHVIDTAPLNPLKGGTDTLKSVKELVNGNPATSGGDLSGNLNPFIAAGIQSLTGKSLLTGAPIAASDKGLVGSVLQQTVTGLPQYKIGVKLVSDVHPTGPDTSNPHTFLTPTGRLKLKYEDTSGHVHLDKNGFPTETPGRHMLNPTTQSLIATFLGVPDRGSVNQKVAKEVEAKIKTTNNPSSFHPAKKRKKKPTFKSVTQPKSQSSWGATNSSWGG